MFFAARSMPRRTETWQAPGIPKKVPPGGGGDGSICVQMKFFGFSLPLSDMSGFGELLASTSCWHFCFCVIWEVHREQTIVYARCALPLSPVREGLTNSFRDFSDYDLNAVPACFFAAGDEALANFMLASQRKCGGQPSLCLSHS